VLNKAPQFSQLRPVEAPCACVADPNPVTSAYVPEWQLPRAGYIEHGPVLSRIYDRLLNYGAYNFSADRQAARDLLAAVPWAALVTWLTRAFMWRAITYLVEQGVDQFADIGSGIPTFGPTHEMLRTTMPNARVVYLDCDPVAVLQGQQLLADIPTASMAQANLCRPDTIIDQLRKDGVDLARPVGLLLGNVLACLADRHAYRAVAALQAMVAPGSWMALTHITPRICAGLPAGAGDAADEVLRRTPTPMRVRDRAAVGRFFTGGWRLVEPGLVDAATWRPDPHEAEDWVYQIPVDAVLAGVARSASTNDMAKPATVHTDTPEEDQTGRHPADSGISPMPSATPAATSSDAAGSTRDQRRT
jgi:hypothetical protein